MNKTIILFLFFSNCIVASSQVGIKLNQEKARDDNKEVYVKKYVPTVIEDNGKYYEIDFWSNGVIKSKAQVELYFADGIKYETNLETGENEAEHYSVPAYRYHGKKIDYDESGIKIIKVQRFKHGDLKKNILI